MSQRYAWTDEHGKPKAPDWNELVAIRDRHERVLASKRKLSEAAETGQHLLSSMDLHVKSFIDFLGGWGEKPFDGEEGTKDILAAGSAISIDIVSAATLHENAAFLNLHPRVRNAILTASALSIMPPQRKSNRSKLAEKRVSKMMAKKVRMSKAKEEYRALVDKVGKCEANALSVPKAIRTNRKKDKNSASKSLLGVKGKTRNIRMAKRAAHRTRISGARRRIEAKKDREKTTSLHGQILSHLDVMRTSTQPQEQVVPHDTVADDPPQPLAQERAQVREAQNSLTVRGLKLLALAKDVESKQDELRATASAGLAEFTNALVHVYAHVPLHFCM
jgi:hypothetical protein